MIHLLAEITNAHMAEEIIAVLFNHNGNKGGRDQKRGDRKSPLRERSYLCFTGSETVLQSLLQAEVLDQFLNDFYILISNFGDLETVGIKIQVQIGLRPYTGSLIMNSILA